MSKVELNSTNLKSGCLLNLNDSISSIKKALNYYNNIDIPFDFNKKNDLINVKYKLNTVLKELEYIKNWIINSNTNYNTLINNLKNQATQLPTSRIKIRNNII